MDDGSPIRFLILILLLILGSAYSSAAETALASVNRIRMMSLADNGNKQAIRVLYILDHFDRALTTILICNNVMHIGCASVATLMATKLWGLSAVTLTTVATTLVLFMFAEMLPKRFAKACNERLALMVSGSLVFLMKALSPVAAVFSRISSLVSRPFKNTVEEPTVTEDELYDIMETVASEGAIDEEKTELVQSALEFSDTVAADILTPWDQVVKVSVAMTVEEILACIRNNVHSRLPVVDVHGEVAGMLQIRKYLKAYLQNNAVSLMKVTDPAHFVSAYMPIDELLPAMSQQKTQLAVVRDDGGTVMGVVSVEDILEELVGEIYDEEDPEVTAK
jgi:putative hemolysin